MKIIFLHRALFLGIGITMLVTLPALGSDTNRLNQLATTYGQTYRSVQVLDVEPDGLLIQYVPPHGGIGIKKIEFADLPGEIQKQYHYNPSAAAAYLKKKKEQRQQAIEQLSAEAQKRRQASLDKINLLKKIVYLYYKTHVYIGKDTGYKQNIFVCGDMACELWDMVERQGIPARIAVGNPDKSMQGNALVKADHAWVLAETEPGKWLALEATGGYVVPKAVNRHYYTCIRFKNPRDFHAAVDLLRNYKIALKKDFQARQKYDALLAQLAKSGETDHLKMRLAEQRAVIDQRDADCRELTNQFKIFNN